jgi:hypothetical protein
VKHRRHPTDLALPRLLGLFALFAQLALPAPVALGQDIGTAGHAALEEPGDAWAFLELSADSDAYVVGQVVELRLRVGLDAAFFATDALPLFRRPMDLPVQVEWDAPAGTLATGDGAADAGANAADAGADADVAAGGAELRTLALGDAVVEARRVEARVVDGRAFTVLELRRRVLPRYAGTLTIPAPVLHFAYATGFRDDFVRGRVPLDRHAARVTGEPLTLDVRPLPLEGRPATFTGAVGRFTVATEAQPRELSVGEQLVLTLTIDGAGQLAAFDAPSLPPMPGFTSVGRLGDEPGPPRRIRYGLVATDASVDALAPVSFVSYDPETGSYRTQPTGPIAVRVRPRTAASADTTTATAPTGGDPERTLLTTPRASDGAPGRASTHREQGAPVAAQGGSRRAWLLVASVCVLGALAWATRRAWRATSASSPPRDGAAITAFRSATAATGGVGPDPTQAFIAYVAARLGCSQAEIVAEGLRDRLVAAGAQAALADRVLACVRERLAARYGGQGGGPGGADLCALAEALDAALGG